MDIYKDLENLCDIVSEQLRDVTRKIKNSGMSSGDLETVDKLTHSLKSIKAVMAMMDKDGEYSGYHPYMGYHDGSYARGRGQRRDSMGRYSGDYGYSRTDLADKMRALMDDAPDDKTRQEIRRMVEKLENA